MSSPTELITFLSRNQFLNTTQGEALSRERQRFVSGVQLCGELVQRGWLTPYQQAQLLSGNGDKLIIGSYRIQSPLGEGGMGMVFKAIQPKLDRVVALKVIRPQVLAVAAGGAFPVPPRGQGDRPAEPSERGHSVRCR